MYILKSEEVNLIKIFKKKTSGFENEKIQKYYEETMKKTIELLKQDYETKIKKIEENYQERIENITSSNQYELIRQSGNFTSNSKSAKEIFKKEDFSHKKHLETLKKSQRLNEVLKTEFNEQVNFQHNNIFEGLFIYYLYFIDNRVKIKLSPFLRLMHL